MIKKWPFGIASTSFLFAALLFTLWPELDIMITGLFYDPTTVSFPANDNLFVQFIYWLFKELPNVIIPLLLALCLVPLLKQAPEWSRTHKRKSYFMLAFLLIGPGIIVHTGFKDNWDRARPRDVVEFGGQLNFTPPLEVSNQCQKNCSFVSGHAAMGFAFIALGWVFRCRRWMTFGIALGLFVGGIRVIQGGHFLSDIIFSGYICYASGWLMAKWMLKEDSCIAKSSSNQ